jgi:hypothetical protein
MNKMLSILGTIGLWVSNLLFGWWLFKPASQPDMTSTYVMLGIMGLGVMFLFYMAFFR